MKRAFAVTVATLALLSGAGMVNSARADNWHGQQHGWNQGQHWDRTPLPRHEFYYQPHYNAHHSVVYYDVVPAYYGATYYPQPVDPYYPGEVYTPRYVVGGYLPSSYSWVPVNDYVRYGLATPHSGQRWVRYNRDAVLIDASSRILSGVLLAASVR